MKRTAIVSMLVAPLLIVSLSVAGFSPALAQGKADPTRIHRRPHIPPFFREFLGLLNEFDLTREQMESFVSLKRETWEAIKPLIDQAEELGVQMEETFLAAEIDTEEASSQIDELVDITSHITRTMAEAKLEAAQILTSEQRQLIWEQKEAAREWRPGWTIFGDRIPPEL
jgi:Spy/CpxP family protein refolding chaperone